VHTQDLNRKTKPQEQKTQFSGGIKHLSFGGKAPYPL